MQLLAKAQVHKYSAQNHTDMRTSVYFLQIYLLQKCSSDKYGLYGLVSMQSNG